MITVGSLFTGYGGLELGLSLIAPTRTAWVADIGHGPRAVLAHRFPGVPNLGDVTTVDWSRVEPVDIIAGGSPCQDLSTAGRRAGMRPGTRSGLWESMAASISQIRPRMVIWENVTGALSASAWNRSNDDRHLGARDWTVDQDQPLCRALGRVAGELSSLGYDAQWRVVRASDVGAPHRRARLFLLAIRRDTAADAHLLLRDWTMRPRGRRPEPPHSSSDGDAGALTLLLTPQSRPDHRQSPGFGTSLSDAVRLLPTPTATDQGSSKSLQKWDAWTASMRARHGNGHGASLSIESKDLGPYQAALDRWAIVMGRPAPEPTDDEGRLSPLFVEHMMGLPPGWVTAVPGISRTAQLRLLGNGVVPQQASYALSTLATWAQQPAPPDDDRDELGTPDMLALLRHPRANNIMTSHN